MCCNDPVVAPPVSDSLALLNSLPFGIIEWWKRCFVDSLHRDSRSVNRLLFNIVDLFVGHRVDGKSVGKAELADQSNEPGETIPKVPIDQT